MHRIFSALAVAALLALPSAASAMDLDVSYRPATTGSSDVEWTFHDVQKGDLPQMTVTGPDGAPVRITLKVTAVDGGKVVTQANFYKIKTNLYGRERAELILRQELAAEDGKSAGAKVVLPGTAGDNAFHFKVQPAS